MRTTITAAVGALLLVGSFASPAVTQPAPLQGLDQYIERAMEDWKIPGLAIGVVRGDSLVFARGYGVRELGGSDAVDEHTVFAIGSASKAFTAAALAMLVDEGKVDWDDPAAQYLPDFRLHDHYATRELTIRDLLTHRSGLARGDQLWAATDFDRAEVLYRVRYLEPSWSFRSQFGYQNILYLAAGEILPPATGSGWDDFVQQRIFEPLGMNRSSTSYYQLEGLDNRATPHGEDDGQTVPIPWRNIDNIGPAGSINSSVTDMAQWIKLQLGAETGADQGLLSEAVLEEMHTPQTLVRREGRWVSMTPTSNFMAYGLGWFLNDHRGRKVVQHGGNIGGMHALVGMMPEEDLGLVILTNRSSNQLTYALMYRVFDAYLGGPATDWSGQLLAAANRDRERAEAQRQATEDARVAGTSPSLSLDAYAGRYENGMFGEARVGVENGSLVIRRGVNFVGDLVHWHYDTFRVAWREPARGQGFVTFFLDMQARVATLELPGFGEFHRIGDRASEGN
jgi:CubicO group peptidase (beta-lactamase class C family)